MSAKPPTSRPLRRTVSCEELSDLYQSIKSAETIGVFDAAEALGNNDIALACQKLTEAKSRYERKHARALARDPKRQATEREKQRAETRRAQVQATLDTFNEYLTVLEKNVKIQRAVPKPPPDPAVIQKMRDAEKIADIPQAVLDQFRGAMSGPEALTLLTSDYELLPIESAHDVLANTLFVVASKGNWHLLRSSLTLEDGDTLQLFNLLTRKSVHITYTALVQASQHRKAMRLVPINERKSQRRASDREEIVLDESELNVLWAVVRDTGLLPNASDITLIKKNEFKRRQYDRALKKMLILQRSFSAGVRAKKNEFSRELAMMESQKQSMSLREIEKRKLKIARAKRLIERAEAHFIKVMNCLHALDSRRS